MSRQDALKIEGRGGNAELKIAVRRAERSTTTEGSKEKMRREELGRYPKVQAKIREIMKAMKARGLKRGVDYEVDMDTGKAYPLSGKGQGVLHPETTRGELKAERERLARGGRVQG